MHASAVAAALCAAFACSPAAAGGISPELLLSSAWCTFRYSKVTGYSSSSRYSFQPNGTYRTGGRSEGGSSGPAGSVYGQSDSSGGGRWAVQQGELFMSDGGAMQFVQTLVKRNSNGYPIIVADGVEYSQCR